MDILILNTNNPLKASGVVSLDLYNEFKKRGNNVKLLVKSYHSDYPDGITCMENKYSNITKKIYYKLNRIFKFRNSKISDPNYHFHEINEKKVFYKTKNILYKAKINPDVIFVLFAKDFINAKNIYELNKITKAPVFWIMFDMAPMTGGCHYAWDCKGYEKSCGSCPGLFSKDIKDISYRNLAFKKKYLDKTKLEIIAASEWQYRQATRSSLFSNRKVHKVLLSIDPLIFKPGQKNTERTKMGLNMDSKVIFFGAGNLHHLRKGPQYLTECLKILKTQTNGTLLDEKIILLIAGKGMEEIENSLPYQIVKLGYLDNTFGIASAYQTADIFLCPSIEDSGPSMINQSLMCGTPIVAFEMGVATDLVITGKTGYMAKLMDGKDLAQGLFNILKLSNDEYSQMSDYCRKLALEKCSPALQIDKLEKIIKNY